MQSEFYCLRLNVSKVTRMKQSKAVADERVGGVGSVCWLLHSDGGMKWGEWIKVGDGWPVSDLEGDKQRDW